MTKSETIEWDKRFDSFDKEKMLYDFALAIATKQLKPEEDARHLYVRFQYAYDDVLRLMDALIQHTEQLADVELKN